MLGKNRLVLLVGLLVLLPAISFSTEINVPADQSTIQVGINVAINGDTVLMAPGDSQEHIVSLISSYGIERVDASQWADHVVGFAREVHDVEQYIISF